MLGIFGGILKSIGERISIFVAYYGINYKNATMRNSKKKNTTHKPHNTQTPKHKERGARTKPETARPSKRGGITLEQIAAKIEQVMLADPTRTYTYRDICVTMGKTSMAQKRMVSSVLEELAVFGQLEEVAMGRYRLARVPEDLVGIFHYRGRTAQVQIEGMDELLTIDERGWSTAMHGDKVRLKQRAGRKGSTPRLEVVEVLERSREQYVGRVVRAGAHHFLVSESRQLRQDVYLPTDAMMDAQPNDMVVARVTDWRRGEKNPRGEVIAVLGPAEDNDVQMHAILAEYGLPYSYPKEVEEAAEALQAGIDPEELQRREDFRDVLTLTIDPWDAKDFDDALSLRSLEGDRWEVGVHIADVSHYVQEGSIIDREAESRATSIYLVDRTIPMLPERLCNYLCSLRPNEEKYAYSCIFTLDAQAQVQGYRIGRTVICSDRRYSYEEAQAVIEGEADEHADAILTLNTLAQKIRQRRFLSGSMAMERDEVRFRIDEEGKPVGIYLKESKPAHQLIEEFMLLANKTVAEHISKMSQGRGGGSATFVYRIHDQPDEEKLGNLSRIAQTLGYQLRTKGSRSQITASLNSLLEESRGRAEGNMLSTIAIRSMAKAKYTTHNIGHYGLAFEHYTHFTSPIRRYPDLMVHRLLTHYLSGDKSRAVDATHYEDLCEHSSAMEMLAAQAERASVRYKQVEYMSQFLGHEFEGVVSGVASWGVYIELVENKCEGLIPMRDLDDDYYDVDEANFRLIGRGKGRIIALGDHLRVRVVRADLERKTLDFTLVREDKKKGR